MEQGVSINAGRARVIDLPEVRLDAQRTFTGSALCVQADDAALAAFRQGNRYASTVNAIVVGGHIVPLLAIRAHDVAIVVLAEASDRELLQMLVSAQKTGHLPFVLFDDSRARMLELPVSDDVCRLFDAMSAAKELEVEEYVDVMETAVVSMRMIFDELPATERPRRVLLRLVASDARMQSAAAVAQARQSPSSTLH